VRKELAVEEQSPLPVTVHMIGNAHIDPVWLWPLSEGRAEVLSTYRTAIALLDEVEGYLFTSGGAVTYQWVIEDDPALFARIRRAVTAGRWALVNGWWLQPDCNIPSGESFARHALYGQRFLQQHFGQRARVGYNVDSFGHAGTLPQLLKGGGLDYYVFFRPDPREKTLPVGPFWWEAPGGTRVLTCRPPLHYGSPAEADIAARIQDAAREAPAGLPVVMCFYGVGNHGGGPTRRNVQAVQEVMRAGGAVRPLFSRPEAYFAEVETTGRAWPVVRDELQHHSRGCYTALSRVKRENRRAEHSLLVAERFAALATALCGAPAAQERLALAWQEVLLNQFHDIMAGTSLRDAYEQSWRAYDEAQRVAAEVQEGALAALSARVRVAASDAHTVLVWNSSPWERREAVTLRVPLGAWRHDFRGLRYPGTPVVRDSEGRALPAQTLGVELDYNTYMVQLVVEVSVPALGVRVLDITIPEVEPPAQEPQPPLANTIENGVYRLTLDPQTGGIASLWDIARGVELLGGTAALPLVVEDPSDTWSHDVVSFRDVIGHFAASGPAELIHVGPLCQMLRVRSAWGRSTLAQEFTLYRGQRAVDVTLRVDWQEQLKMLKLAFPLPLRDTQVTASAPNGWVRRAAQGEEEPCQGWVDLSGQGAQGAAGLTLLNDSKYGYDATESELRLSVLRSPIYAFHRPRQVVPGVTYPYLDQGEQTLRYRVLPHDGEATTWLARAARQSEALHEPLLARAVAPQAGAWGEGSLLRVEPANVVLTTVKMAEEGRRLLARGYEAAGQATRLTLVCELLGLRWEHDLSAHGIWTLALPLDGSAPQPCNLLEE
jgi:alpha-mannosidase